ncbi:hypothetical protein RGU70_14400 [Herbaspirillum sp. RTI4]|uniref:hypothetical protein n=1 Tax=Herbaspirillum sp. RTI4 TaxID=3048640 RepID=UPI002AB4CB75|nr:hypothetical protein [Herbaspirillum sp. RTI4]MDY7579506.1 hypothetical protein [Herbaspirillum sp. RTI4]
MKTQLSDRLRALSPALAWGAVALSVAALFATPGAMAAAPPAKTKIGNQASASYVDANGKPQLSTSNLVQTEVAQVGSFTLTSDNVKSAGAGNTIYAPHTLTNTGNGPDDFSITVSDSTGAFDFSKIEVFEDANGDGQPDSTTPLCSVTPSATATCKVAAKTVAGNGGTFKFVVAYSVPGNQAASTDNTAIVQAAPVASSLLSTYAPATLSNTDKVTVTNLAAFSANKSMDAPKVAAPGGAAWPKALSSGPRSAAANCPTSFAAISSSPTCSYTVYTVTYRNTGGVAGVFQMEDKLPSGLTYVTGSAVWSSAGGVALGDGPGGDPSGIDFNYSAAERKLTAKVGLSPVPAAGSATPADWVGPNVSGTISFVVLINETAAVGTSTTTNKVTYTSPNEPGIPPTETNPAPFEVTATYGVVMGNAVATVTSGKDVTPGTADGADDLNTIATATAGSTLRFTQKLYNTGNAADTFNLSMTGNTFPAGTLVWFFKSDGLTPLLDTDRDKAGKPDTGLIAANSSVTIVVLVSLPDSIAAGAGPFDLTVRAESSNDANRFDAAKDKLTSVNGIPVDLTNTPVGTGIGSVGNGDAGMGPSPLPTTTLSIPAGTPAAFALFIKNNDSNDNNYTLEASQTTSFPGSLPTGWSVRFVAAGGVCSDASLTSIAVAKNTQKEVKACVTPPLSAANLRSPIYFKVTSLAAASSGAIVSDMKLDAVTVTAPDPRTATLEPPQTGQVGPGGTVVYPHTLSVNGSCGTYTLTATSQWGTPALFIDQNNNGVIDPSDPPVTSSSFSALASGGKQKILVRVQSPAGATPGLQGSVVVTATFDAINASTPACAPTSVTDISTVVSGQIRVLKTQLLNPTCSAIAPSAAYTAEMLNGAKPGSCIDFKVVATNEGTAAAGNMRINDALPNYTSFIGATQPAQQCVATAGVTGSPVVAVAGGNISCGTATQVPPGDSLTLFFSVKVNE